jgi:hypothetical protein
MPGAEDHTPIDGAVMERSAAMGTGLVEREHFALVAKQSDPLFSDVDGDGASVGDIVNRGDSATHEHQSSVISYQSKKRRRPGIAGESKFRTDA